MQLEDAIHYQPGTIIRTRQRLWRVDRQTGEVLVATTIDGGATEQHRLFLGRDEYGRPFEEISREQLHVPDVRRIGNPAMQTLLLRAYRLSLLHGAAPLVSLQHSRVIPTDYQLVPVAMALELPRVRLALFDDVGLGKTIEAGLIVTELLARQLATRVLLICPANLREQWREALEYFFHLDARIMSQQHRRAIERQLPQDANPWEFFTTLIASEDYAKQPAIRQEIAAQSWDVVIFDEAHTLAKPHQSGPDAAVDMERWELAKLVALSPRVRHLLLLTATPHNGYTDSFASLLRLLDVDAVSGPEHAPIIHREVARRHVCQRTRIDIAAWFERAGKPSPLPKRDQQDYQVSPNETEDAVYAAVDAYASTIFSAAHETRYAQIATWTVMHLYKRALSSPEALRRSLRNRRKAIKEREAARASGVTDEVPVVSDRIARANALDNEPGERLNEEEVGVRVDRTLFPTPPQQQREEEIAQIDRLVALVERVTPAKDSKLQTVLRNVLPEMLRRHNRVIIFSRYRDTMEYIAEQLRKTERFRDVHIVCVEGSMSEQQRKEAFAAFRDFGDGKVKRSQSILVATDAISEGINLQELCCQMIHWELPWNPNRLEQRVGRIDRFGQPEPTVFVRLLVMNDTFEAKVLKVLVEKARQIREDYGFAPPYFGDELTLLDLMREHQIPIALGPRQGSLWEWQDHAAVTPVTLRDPFTPAVLDTMRSESFYGATDISIPAIEERRRQTDATIGSPVAIREFVRTALRRFGANIHDHEVGVYRGTFRVELTDEALAVAGTDMTIPFATFDPEAALVNSELTLLDLGHPLVRRLLDLIKERAFTNEQDYYGRTATYRVVGLDRVTAVVHVLARSVVATEPPSLIEELLTIAFPLYETDHAMALPLAASEVAHILALEPSPTPVDSMDAHEDLALSLEVCQPYIAHAIDAQLTRLIAERRDLLAQARHDSSTERSWLRGIDVIAPASHDLITICVLYPG